MDKVFIVQFDWATPDAEGIDLYVYKNYDDAYDKFKQLISEERNPELSWVGDLEFDDDGYPTDDRYEFSFEDNNSNESEVRSRKTKKAGSKQKYRSAAKTLKRARTSSM